MALVAMLPLVLLGTAPQAAGNLTAAQVRAQIVGHEFAIGTSDDAVTWRVAANGSYTAEDRLYHEGRYTVRPDGLLCWKESNGIAGCFQFYRQGKTLRVRRNDPGHHFDLDEVTVRPLG